MYTLETLKSHSLESARNLYSQGFVSQDTFDAFYDLWTEGRKTLAAKDAAYAKELGL